MAGVIAPAQPGSPPAEKPLMDWLERVDRAVETPLSTDDRRFAKPTVTVSPQSIYLTKSRRPGVQVSAIKDSNLLNSNISKYYCEIDKTLLSLLWTGAVTFLVYYGYDDGCYLLS